MRNGMIIIDADGHALDQESMYRQRLPEQFRKRQSIGGGGDGFDRRQNGRIPYPPVTVERYLQDADLEGIDVMVLYPTAAWATRACASTITASPLPRPITTGLPSGAPPIPSA